MRLAVILLNWNQSQQTIECVRLLAPDLPEQSIVWVVDNASQGTDVAEIRSALPEVRLLTSTQNRGFAGGCNLGLKAASRAACDAILLLNCDARIDSPDLARLLGSLAENPRLAVVGPLLYDARDPTRLLAAGGRDIGLYIHTHHTRLPETALHHVDYIPGTCALLRTAAVMELGPFDERYFFSGEVADFCARATHQGWQIAVDSEARALHDPDSAGILRNTLYAYYSLRNRFLYVRLHHSSRQLRLSATWTWRSLAMWRSARAADDRPRARALRLACLDGLTGRFGNQNRRILGSRCR